MQVSSIFSISLVSSCECCSVVKKMKKLKVKIHFQQLFINPSAKCSNQVILAEIKNLFSNRRSRVSYSRTTDYKIVTLQENNEKTRRIPSFIFSFFFNHYVIPSFSLQVFCLFVVAQILLCPISRNHLWTKMKIQFELILCCIRHVQLKKNNQIRLFTRCTGLCNRSF